MSRTIVTLVICFGALTANAEPLMVTGKDNGCHKDRPVLGFNPNGLFAVCVQASSLPPGKLNVRPPTAIYIFDSVKQKVIKRHHEVFLTPGHLAELNTWLAERGFQRAPAGGLPLSIDEKGVFWAPEGGAPVPLLAPGEPYKTVNPARCFVPVQWTFRAWSVKGAVLLYGAWSYVSGTQLQKGCRAPRPLGHGKGHVFKRVPLP